MPHWCVGSFPFWRKSNASFLLILLSGGIVIPAGNLIEMNWLLCAMNDLIQAAKRGGS